MKELYHYCSNDKCFNILKSRSIRLSDIQKSNDYRELSLFFPEILNHIEEIYKRRPFYLECDGKFGEEAISQLLNYSYDYWKNRFATGEFSNFVLCFSEDSDSLSQWRGYADNARGCCIGFSKNQLEEYIVSTNGVLILKKVIYLTEEGIENIIIESAKKVLRLLNGLREWIVSEITKDNSNNETNILLHYNFNSILESIFIDSLQYKSIFFKEEQEWRMYFARTAYKNPNWICDKTTEFFTGPKGFSETIKFIQKRIDFHSTVDDLIPYCQINFDEFKKNPVSSIWLGPKNNIRTGDIELFLKKFEYDETKVIDSQITYC